MEAICKIKIQRLFTLSEITLEDLRKAGLSNTKTIKGGFTAEDALKYLVSLLKNQNLSDKKLHKVIEAIYCLFYFAEDNKINLSKEGAVVVMEIFDLPIKERLNENGLNYYYWLIKILSKNYDFSDVTIQEEEKENSIDYEEVIRKLEKKIEVMTKKIEQIKSKNEESTNDVRNLTSINKDLKLTGQKEHQRLLDIQKQLEMLKKENSNLQSTLKSKNLKIQTLQKSEKSLQEERERLKTVIANKERILDSKNLANQRNENLYEQEIDFLLLSFIIGKTPTLEEIKNYLKQYNYNFSMIELKKYMEKFSIKYGCITINTLPVTYTLKRTELKRNLHWKMDSFGQDYIDILLCSDLHLWKLKQEISEQIYELYNYCIKDDIKYIINLGDFFGIHNNDFIISDAEGIEIIREKIIDIVRAFPTNTGIYHCVMGGNHDEILNEMGMDPLELVCQENFEFVNLGYEHSMLEFNSDNNQKQYLNFHHPHYRFSEKKNEMYNKRILLNYLKKYYGDKVLIKNNSYFDFFGHLHISSFDKDNKYLILPSLFKDRVKNGMFKLRIYFKRNGLIDYMIFTPLYINGKIEKGPELIYHKK